MHLRSFLATVTLASACFTAAPAFAQDVPPIITSPYPGFSSSTPNPHPAPLTGGYETATTPGSDERGGIVQQLVPDATCPNGLSICEWFYQVDEQGTITFEPLSCHCFKSDDWLIDYIHDSTLRGPI